MEEQPDTTECAFCNRLYVWDWEQDEWVGAESAEFTSPQKPDVTLHVYFCKCGATLGAVTSEPLIRFLKTLGATRWLPDNLPPYC